MQRYRLTEYFALEIGDKVAWPLHVAPDTEGVTAVPIHLIRTEQGNLILNGDSAPDAATNNIREISCIDKNVTYSVPLRLTPRSYTDVLMQNFDDCKFGTNIADNMQYTRCKLYAVEGFVWPADVAGLYMRMSQQVAGETYILRNLCLMRDQSQYTFKPVNTKTVVIDNELFASQIQFDILDLNYVSSVVSDTAAALRAFLFGSIEQVQVTSNIDVTIGFIYTNDVYSFQSSLYDDPQVYLFNEFSLRSIKEAPLLSGDLNGVLYAKAEYMQGSAYSNPFLQLSMAHRSMQLDSYVQQQGASIDSVSLVYDITIQTFNVKGKALANASSYTTLQNSANVLSPVNFAPVIVDGETTDTKIHSAAIYVTATLTMQSALGDTRVSRATQIVLNMDQLADMCWRKQTKLDVHSVDIIHKVVNERIQIENTAGAGTDRVLYVNKPVYVQLKQIVVNDSYVSTDAVVRLPCAKNASINVALQLVDAEGSLADLTGLKGCTAVSGKGVIKDMLSWSANSISFSLSHNEGEQTTYHVLTSDGTEITQIVLSQSV